MPSTCSVVGCNTWDRPKDVVYHRFPKEKRARKEWVVLCGNKRVNFLTARICSIHFEKTDYERNLKYEMLNLPVPRRLRNLKKDAIPSKHIPKLKMTQSPFNIAENPSRKDDNCHVQSQCNLSNVQKEKPVPMPTQQEPYEVYIVECKEEVKDVIKEEIDVIEEEIDVIKEEIGDVEEENDVNEEDEDVIYPHSMQMRVEEIHSLGTGAEPMFMTWEENGLQNSSGDAVNYTFVRQLQKVIQDGNYTPDQVFTATKTGLFWKRLPAQTFISKKEKMSTGFKAGNDLFTLLLCANASRDFRLKPLLVYRSLSPKELKVTSLQMLPVHWRFNKRVSLTATLFEDWFTNCAVPEISSYCKQKNLEEKAVLLVDNSLGYPEVITDIHPTIKIISISSDKFPSIQHLDQFAITQFKQLYTKSLLHKMLFITGGGDESQVEDFWLSFSIKEALIIIRDSWMAVKTPFLNRIWRYVWLDILQYYVGPPNTLGEIQEIRELANKIPGEGFMQITDDDIRSHIKSHWENLSAEELTEQAKDVQEDDNQKVTPESSLPSTSELKSIIKLLYKTERTLIEKEWNPSRLEHSLTHLRSIRAIYMDALKKRDKTKSYF